MLLFSRQDNIIYILDTTILILYRKLYGNIVSIIVLNIEAIQYNIKINLAILRSPKQILQEAFLLFSSISDWRVNSFYGFLHFYYANIF